MQLTVREMRVEEADLIVDYFHNSTPEHLDTLGVDPTRLPTPEAWRDRYHRANPPQPWGRDLQIGPQPLADFEDWYSNIIVASVRP